MQSLVIWIIKETGLVNTDMDWMGFIIQDKRITSSLSE